MEACLLLWLLALVPYSERLLRSTIGFELVQL
jgi:hypothetical protein